jgi:hypothetical protein
MSNKKKDRQKRIRKRLWRMERKRRNVFQIPRDHVFPNGVTAIFLFGAQTPLTSLQFRHRLPDKHSVCSEPADKCAM